MRQPLLLLYMVTLASLLTATSPMPKAFCRPDLSTRVFTTYYVLPAADSLCLPQIDSLDCALASTAAFRQAVGRFVSPRDTTGILLKWKHEKTQLAVRADAGAEISGNADDHAMFVATGLHVQAQHGPLGLYARWWSGHYTGNLDYAEASSSLLDSWLKREDGRIYIDNLQAWMHFSTVAGDFLIARSKPQVGNGVSGSIILSDAANDYGWFGWALDVGPVSLSLMHGDLVADSVNAEGNYPEKYLVLHKLDWTPGRLHLFVGETIVYGNRAPDASYLLPHTFYRITEHILGNQDNVLIFAGYDWRASDRLTLYGQLVMDELRKKKLFTNWWGNKYALQGGAAIQCGSLPGGDARLVLEGVAVRPWMYTHNTATGHYTHDGISLGYPDGANLVSGTVELNLPLRPRLAFDGAFTWMRQGSVGCHPLMNYDDRPAETAHWLEGDIATSTRLASVVTWQLLAHHALKFGCRYTDTDNKSARTDLNLCWHTEY